MNTSLQQLIREFFDMPKILGCLPKWIPMHEKHNKVHMMAYDVLTNLLMFLRCFTMFLFMITSKLGESVRPA